MRPFAFKNLADLVRDVRAWLDDLPNDLDLVVGVPRSGLLIANLISLYRHIPMADPDGLIAGRLLGGGHRFDWGTRELLLEETRRILVVDDSLLTGRQMARTRAKLAATVANHEVFYAAVYVEPGMEHAVDFHHELLPYPLMFEWNYMHHPALENACMDIDGVLCRDPTREEDDDGARYLDFIQNVEPRARPAFTVGTLVTCRLEKYRPETEAWLDRHGIRFKKLVMMSHASKAERIAAGLHTQYKAQAYTAARAGIFIESSLRQAREIAELANRPVIATDRMVLATPRIQTKSDIFRGLREAGSLGARLRWLRGHKRAIGHWARRRWDAKRD